jgi:hypothetical protein
MSRPSGAAHDCRRPEQEAVRARLDTEMARLEDLGRRLATVPINAAGLAGDGGGGLRGLWLSVTRLDSKIVAHVPDQQPLSDFAS